MNKKRITWIELLRIAACIAVIGIHAGSQHFRDIPIDTFAWKVSNFFHGINRFAVAGFIMISGSLYLDRKRNWDIRRLWTKNILSVAAAYFFWQIFYAVYRILIQGGPVPEGTEFIKRLLIYVSDPWFHLWYLPMLIGLLILTPLLWEIVNSSRGKQWCEYMIVLFLVFQILTYTAGCFDLPWKSHVQNLLNTVHPELITSYVGYYVLGHYLYEYGMPKKLEKIIYILGVGFILAGIWLGQQKSIETGKPIQAFYDNFTVAVFFWSVAIFLFFKNYISKIKWSERQEKFICNMGGCTFGIYLIHALVRDLLHRNGIDSMMMSNTVIAIPIVIFLIFIISWIAAALLRKIPFVKRWLM